MEHFRKLSVGRVSDVCKESGFPSQIQLQKNGQIFVDVSKQNYRCHFFIGPVRQNLKALSNAKWSDHQVVCELDETNQVLWWSKLTREFSNFLKVIRISHPSLKRIETLMKGKYDDLYLVYEILHGGRYKIVKDQMQPVLKRPLHPFRRLNMYKRYRGYCFSHNPLYLSFLTTAMSRTLCEYEKMFDSLPEKIKSEFNQFNPANLRLFTSSICDETC